MKRTLAVFAMVVAGLLAAPPRAAAQCNEACVRVTTPEGLKGYGCVVVNDSGEACIARSTACFTKLCYNAMVIDPSGRALASADICDDKVTINAVVRGGTPVRVARAEAPKRSATASHARPPAKARAG